MAEAYPPENPDGTEQPAEDHLRFRTAPEDELLRLRDFARDRQLNVLRSTYPGWIIDRFDQDGVEWRATLRTTPTERMREIGVVQTLTRSDAIAMAAALSCQAALVHSCRTQFWAT